MPSRSNNNSSFTLNSIFIIAFCITIISSVTYLFPEQILPHLGIPFHHHSDNNNNDALKVKNSHNNIKQLNEKELNQQFTKWFIENGGIIENLEVSLFNFMGRGFLLKQTIHENDRILYIPNHLIFSKYNLKNYFLIKNKNIKLYQKFLELDNDEESLIGWLLYEKALHEKSFFYPYLSIMPSYVPSLLYFNNEQLNELQNDELKLSSITLQNHLKNSYKKFKDIFFKQNLLQDGRIDTKTTTESISSSLWPNDKIVTWEEYIWASTMFNSRGLRFSGDVYMAPMADIFNYEPHPIPRAAKGGDFFLLHHVLGGSKESAAKDSSIITSSDELQGSITVYADRDAFVSSSSTEQIQYLEDYGDNPDEIYFKYHGFVPTINPFRCVQLVTAMNQTVFEKLTYTKKKILHALEFPRPPACCIDSSGTLSRPVEVFFAIVAMTDTEAAKCLETAERSKRQWNVIFAACNFNEASADLYSTEPPSAASSQQIIPSIGKRTLLEFQEFLIDYVRNLPFRTTIPQDETLLRYFEAKLKVKTSSTDVLHRFNAVKYRLAQKKLWTEICQKFHTPVACEYLLVPDELEHTMKSEMTQSSSADLPASQPVTPPHASPNTIPAGDGPVVPPVAVPSEIPAIAPIPPPATKPSSIPAGDSPVDPPTSDPSSIPAGDVPVLPPEAVPTAIPGDGPVTPPQSTPSSIPAGDKPIPPPQLTPSSIPAGDTPIPPPQVEPSSIPGLHPIMPPVDDRDLSSSREHVRRENVKFDDEEKDEMQMTMEEKLIRFNEWFNNLGPMPNHLEARIIPGFRIGTVAATDIRKNSLYIGVPAKRFGIMNSAIALQNSSVTPLVSQLVAAYSRRDDFHELLFFLMNEYFVLGTQSKYWPYLSLLPREEELDIPLFWTAEEVHQRLGASHLINTVMKYHKTTSTRYEALKKMAMITDFFPSNVFNYENYRWATAILDSRSIWWSGRRNLVPMLDFVNCMEDEEDPDRLHSTVLDPDGDYAITYSPRNFPKGEQLFENYGQPNHIYFVYHGFVLDSNTHDCAHIDLPISENEMRALNLEKAKPIIERLRLVPGRASTMPVCLTTPIAQSVWAFMALKTNDFEDLAEKQLLGQSYPAGIKMLIQQIDERLIAHETHVPSNNEKANLFLKSERAKFLEVKARLVADLNRSERQNNEEYTTITFEGEDEEL